MMRQQKIVSPSFIGDYILEDLSICDELIDFHKKDPLKKKKEGRIGPDNQVDIKVKNSIDMHLYAQDRYKYRQVCPAFELYIEELENILNKYKKEYTYSDNVNEYAIVEAMNLQYYKPKGGFYPWHSERIGPSNRHLVFMTYLNNVPDGGTEFYYQNYTSEAVKGRTLIWPTDWTHTHRGQITDTHEKYIITGWFSYL